MPKAERRAADVVLQCWAFQVVGNDFSTDKRAKSAGVANLAAQFKARECSIPITWATEIIRLNLNGIGGIGTCKAHTTATLGLNDVTDKGPTTRRKAKSCSVASAYYSLQNLEVRAT